MAITPTTTIVASPQAGLSRFFVKQINNDLVDDWGAGYPSIYANGSDQYSIFYHITNFGALTDNQIWKISVFKNSTQQDSSNEPGTVNPSLHNTKIYANCLTAAQIGTVLYIPHWNASGFLAVAKFDMATDLFLTTVTSSLTPGTPATVDAGTTSGTGGTSCAYVANLDLLYIFTDGFSVNAGGQDYSRPAYVRFDIGGGTFDVSFTVIGHDNSFLLGEACYGAAAGDCRDAVSLGIWQRNNAGQESKVYFQTIYSDNSLSAVQDTGVVITTPGGFPANIACPIGKLLCTGTEFIIPYSNTFSGAGSYYDKISVVRSTVPSSDTLPVSWTIEAVHNTDASYHQVYGFTLFRDGDDLTLVYTLNGGLLGNGIKIACATCISGTWTDGATLGSPATMLFVRGTLESTAALVTYDFTATATDVIGTNTISGGNNQLFAFVSLVEPTCDIPVPLAIVCPILGSITVGVFFSTSLADVTSGGTAPYTWAIPSGLPPGITLDVATGIISGTPTQDGSFSYSVTVTDSLGATATVDAPCPIVISLPSPPFCEVVPAGESPALIAYNEPLELLGS